MIDASHGLQSAVERFSSFALVDKFGEITIFFLLSAFSVAKIPHFLKRKLGLFPGILGNFIVRNWTNISNFDGNDVIYNTWFFGKDLKKNGKTILYS